MKKQSLALVGAIMFAAVASATTYTWKGGTGSPVAPCAWSDPANWEDSSGQDGYPNGDEADVYITSATAVYVKLTENITVRKADHALAGLDKVIVISDDYTFTLAGVASTRCLRGFSFYCPFLYRTDVLPWVAYVRFCGNVNRAPGSAAGSFPMAHSGQVVFSYDRFAEDASSIRTYAFLDTMTFYSTSFLFDAPRTTSTANSWKFTTTKESRFIVNAQGNGLPIPVGATVTGTGIPAGTFVKRVFGFNSGEYVELSQPATASATSTLDFAPFSSKLTVDITSVNHNGAPFAGGLYASQWRDDDDVEIIVHNLGIPTNLNGTFVFGVDADAGYSIPAKITVWAPSGMAAKQNVQLVAAHLHFPEPDAQHTKSGFADQAVTQKDSSSFSLFTVTNGVEASIFSLSNAVGRIIKDGAGTLTISSTDLGTTVIKSALAIEAGVLELPAQDYALKDILIDAGAVLKIDGAARVSAADVQLSFGAVLDGPFTLVLPKRSSISGIVFRNGAKVELASGNTVEPEPVGEVVGNPAFWVDMKRSQMVIQADYSGRPFGHTTGFSGAGVKEIWDVRKQSQEDAYLFSTNSNDNYLPTLRDDSTRMGDGKPKYDRKYLHIYGNYVERKYSTDPADPHYNDKATANVTDGDFHVWSKPVAKIRAIFQVCSVGDYRWELGPRYGGQILGTSGRLYDDGITHYMDWGRYPSAEAFSTKLAPTWNGGGSDAVRKGRLIVNGVEQDFATATYPYQTTLQSGAPAYTNYLPIVMVVIPDATQATLPAADSYSYIGNPIYGCQGFCGNKLLSELIVYTNELTETEITKVSQYLMDKWLYSNVDAKNDSLGSVDSSSGSVSVTVPADSSYLIEEVAGTLMKDGPGEVYVGHVHNAKSVIAAASGTLTIRSRGLTDALVPTNGLKYSFDASDLDSITWQDSGNGVTNVTAWADTRGSGKAVGSLDSPMTNPRKPTLVAKAVLGGKSVIDFGAVKNWPAAEWGNDTKKGETPVLWFTSAQESDRIRSVVAVWGSEHGGGTIAGGGRFNSRYKAGRFTLSRDGTWGTDLIGSDATKALVANNECPMIAQTNPILPMYPQGWRYSRNGTSYNPLTTGLSGSFDTVSLVAYENFGIAGFSGLNSTQQYAGGEQIGEYLAWERGLSPEQVRDVEAYLNYKWFGKTTPGYDGALVGSLSVVSGATVRVIGGAPLMVGGLTLGGTVEGSIVFAAGSELFIDVASDGSTVTQDVGDWDFSQGGTIGFSGDAGKLAVGRHVIFTDAENFPLERWTLAPWTHRPRLLVTLGRDGTDVVLDVAKPGMSIILR